MRDSTKRIMGRLLVGLFLFLAVNVRGESFDRWWPWIYRNVNNNTNAMAWIAANSNAINYIYGQTNGWTEAADWVGIHSNSVQYMETRTNDWERWGNESNLYMQGSAITNYVENSIPAVVHYFLDSGSNSIWYSTIASSNASVIPATSDYSITYATVTNNQYLTVYAFAEQPTELGSGTYSLRMYAQKTAGTKNASFTWEGYEWTNGIVKGDYETGGDSGTVPAGITLFDVPFVNTNDVMRSTNGLFGIKLRVNSVTGGGTQPTLKFWTGPTYPSVLESPSGGGIWVTQSELAAAVANSGIWDAALTNGTISGSNAWALIKVDANNFRLDYMTNTMFAGSGTTGQVTSAAADAGKYLKADGSWATPAAGGSTTRFRVYKSAGQSMALGSSTLTWETADFDDNSDVDLANEWFDVPSNGKYYLGACCRLIDLDDGEYYALKVVVDGAVAGYLGQLNSAAANQDPIINAGAFFDLTAGEHVTIQVEHNHGAGALFSSGVQAETYFYGWDVP